MQAAQLRSEEITGLMLALFLHLALLAVLVARLLFPAEPLPKPERITVSFAEDVGLESAAPDPVAESRAPEAPMVSEIPTPIAPQPLPTTRPSPQPSASTSPRPRPSPTTRPPVNRNQDTRRRPDRPESRPSTQPSSRPSTRPSSAATGGASRIGSDFVSGAGSSTTTSETRIPASQIGASAKASLLQSLARQLKPHWSAPDGADADKLFTMVSWQMNEDGSLRGAPSCKPTQGVTDSNRPQAERHCDYAIRAVRRAAPFKLPDEYYNAWKSVRDFKFSGTL